MYKIRHPNCVRLFGNFEDENFCYFIMEYIPGGNLYTLMASNRNTGLNIYLVASIMRQLVSAIYYLHNMSPPIIHRDIKPENVLIENNSKIKLTDFGWSNYIDFEGEQRSTFCGTPIYLSPEMIQNLGHDEHVDIWCLGVLLFELLAGRPPFLGQSRVLLMKNIIDVNIVWPEPPRLPMDPDAKDLISKILKKNPKERINLENIVKHKFFIKYCPNEKPILDKNQKYHLKPFII
jgi:serine/threonine protein kinase